MFLCLWFSCRFMFLTLAKSFPQCLHNTEILVVHPYFLYVIFQLFWVCMHLLNLDAFLLIMIADFVPDLNSAALPDSNSAPLSNSNSASKPDRNSAPDTDSDSVSDPDLGSVSSHSSLSWLPEILHLPITFLFSFIFFQIISVDNNSFLCYLLCFYQRAIPIRTYFLFSPWRNYFLVPPN